MKQFAELAKHNKPNLLLAHTNDGVTYYRHILPLKYLARMGWNITMSDFNWGEAIKAPKNIKTGGKVVVGKYNDREMDYLCRHADILITQRNDVPGYNANSNLTQLLYRLPWVLDTDDNVHATRPTNPGFYSYHPNSDHQFWGVMAQNDAFAVTVSTENLMKVYGKNNKRMFLLPNGIDVEEWDGFMRGRRPDDEIRISLMLSGGHYEGLQMIEKVLIEVLKAYPQVKLYVMASFKKDYLTKLPKEQRGQLVWQEWVSPKEWVAWNKKMAFDIGLAPLLDDGFNRAKSNLRILEYGIQGLGVVASPVEPYLPVIGRGVVLSAKTETEWFDAISRLIEDADLRRGLGSSLEQYVRQNFDMKDLAKEYDRVYRQIIKEFKELYGEPLRDKPLAGISADSISTEIDELGDRIFRDNTGRKSDYPRSKLTPTRRPAKLK